MNNPNEHAIRLFKRTRAKYLESLYSMRQLFCHKTHAQNLVRLCSVVCNKMQDFSGMMTNSKINSLTKKTLFGITSPAEGKTGEKLVYTISVTTETGDSKELANAAQL